MFIPRAIQNLVFSKRCAADCNQALVVSGRRASVKIGVWYKWVGLSLIAFLILPLTLPASARVYATNSGSEIAVLNADNNTFIKKFVPSIEGTTASNLQGVAISPDQTTAYVVDGGNQGLWIINTRDDTTRAFVPLGSTNNPLQVNVLPDGSKVYVADKGAGFIWVVLTENNSVSVISIGAIKPSGLAFNLSGTKLYVSDVESFADSVYIYRTSDDSLLGTIAGVRANFIAVNSLGIGYDPDSVSTDIATFDTETDTPGPSISTSGSDLDGVAFTNDGERAYVASNGDNTLQVIVNGVLGTPIPLTLPPWQVAVNPENNQQVYCTANPNSTVMVVYQGVQLAAPDFDDNLSNIGYLAYLVSLAPQPPVFLTGSVIYDQFLSQIDTVHRLTWGASPSPDVVSYTIARNGIQIANVPMEGPLSYDDHNQSFNVVDFYEVTAVNGRGDQSDPVSVFIN